MDWPKKILRIRRRPRGRELLSVVVLAGAAVGLVALLTHTHKLAGMLESRPASAATPVTPPAPLPPTQLVGHPAGSIANATHQLVVTLSAPVSPTSPAPMLTPNDAGTWQVKGDSEVFTPASTLAPCSSYTLTVWARTVSTGHAPLGKRRTLHLNVACPPVAGLQQALARLGYLAAHFHPRYLFHEPAGPLTRSEAAIHAYDPPRGGFTPGLRGAPPVRAGQLEATTRGALTIYQGDRGLQATGEPNRSTWESLLYDLNHYRRDPQPYTWVTVSEALPESLAVHRGSHVAFTTPVNTGVPGAETQLGIFPIYARYVSTTMSGTDVDGESYVVPDVPWVNYFNGGDAVHGYPRAEYGFPQSNGCVELPIENAHVVFGMLAVGDIVWVQ